jgi:putative ABC transport system permease protein
VAARLALRDLARYQGRSAAALGAIVLAVGIASTIAVSAAYQVGVASETAGNLADDQLVVHLAPHAGEGPIPHLDPAELAAAREHVHAMADALDTQNVVELDRAVNPNAPEAAGFGPGLTEPATLVEEVSDGSGVRITPVAVVYVATPELLAHLGITAADFDPTADLVSSRADLGGLKLLFGARQELDPEIQRVAALPAYTSGPSTLLTPQAVQRLGLDVVPAGWLLQSAHALTPAQVARARGAAAAGGFEIETRSSDDSLVRLGNQMTAAGVVLALGVLAMTVGLIRSESANDLRTLAASGAGPRTRRALTAVTAGGLALLGGILGTAGAYVGLAAWHRNHLHPLAHDPVADLAVLVVGLPLLAFVGGWVVAGREPRGLSRRPLD